MFHNNFQLLSHMTLCTNVLNLWYLDNLHSFHHIFLPHYSILHKAPGIAWIYHYSLKDIARICCILINYFHIFFSYLCIVWRHYRQDNKFNNIFPDWSFEHLFVAFFARNLRLPYIILRYNDTMRINLWRIWVNYNFFHVSKKRKMCA